MPPEVVHIHAAIVRAELSGFRHFADALRDYLARYYAPATP